MIRFDGPWCLRCATPLCVDGSCAACMMPVRFEVWSAWARCLEASPW